MSTLESARLVKLRRTGESPLDQRKVEINFCLTGETPLDRQKENIRVC